MSFVNLRPSAPRETQTPPPIDMVVESCHSPCVNALLEKLQVGFAILVALAAIVAGCKSPPKSLSSGEQPAPASAAAQAAMPGPSVGWLVGTWRLDVGETAAVLARARFGTNAVITIKRGASSPETNLVHTPFTEEAYAESKAFWERGLAEMGWQLHLKPDHSGEGVARDSTNAVQISPLRWQVLDRELQIEYVAENKFRHATVRIVSSNELHYPMQPLGGYLVLRHSP